MGNKIWLWTGMILLTVSSCRTKTTGIVGYMKYMTNPKNGLVLEKEIDGMDFKVQWMTPDLMALNELKKTRIDQKEWEKTKKEYEGLLYCQLTIKGMNGQHIHALLSSENMDIESVEAYLNLNAQKDIYLTSGEDTSACVLYSFSKTYGLAKQFDIATGFDNKIGNEKEDYVFEFDASFLERGLVKFRFKREDIVNTPILTI